jgi:glutamate 5-kinase
MPGTAVRQSVIANARRLVVKVGTNAITDSKGRLELATLRHLAGELTAAMKAGIDCVLVASGAVGAGMGELDLPARPKSLPQLQAVAAVGQGQLMRTFHDTFKRRGVRVAQVLLTRDDFENRTRYLNIRNTLSALHEQHVLPILNENDAVATDELRFGDNDIIAAHVTNMLTADLLVLLTSVDGVLEAGRVRDVIEQVDDEAIALADGQTSTMGSGGMGSKIAAAGLVTRAGEAAVIANAREKKVLTRLLKGDPIGTVFIPASRKLSSRRRWIGQAARPLGTLSVDAGAARALVQQGKSLLASGIVDVRGDFTEGATLSVVDPQGRQIARGLSNYTSEQIARIKGLKSSQIEKALGEKPYDEVIHRNNMTVG